MYLFFDRNGTLKEQITSPARVGDSNVNSIYVYWDNEIIENLDVSDTYCRYKKPNGEYSLNLQADYKTVATIPYNQDRDLKFFKYFKDYTFFVFNIPDDVFTPLENMNVYSVLFSCWFINDDTIKTMGLVAFGVEPSTQSVSQDENINIAQWNELIKLIANNEYENINVLTITFKNSSTLSSTGLSVKDGNIYWKGVIIATGTDIMTLSTNQTVSGKKTFTGELVIRDLINFDTAEEDEPLIKVETDSSRYNVKVGNGDDDYDIFLPNETGRLLTDKALTPKALTPSVCRDFGHVSGDSASVLISGSIGTYTVPVLPFYQIVASATGGSISNIDQATGVITIYSSEETVFLEWFYENADDPTDTRIGFKYQLETDYNGLYLFTHSNLIMLVPIYSLVENTTYKFTGLGIQDAETGSVMNLIHNMRRVGNVLEIWSGNSDYPMIENRIGYLFKIKLY